MIDPAVDEIARTVLYEGYILYPYRPALKNRQRWTFGGLFPRAYCDRIGQSEKNRLRLECLVQARPDALLNVTLRFLHVVDRRVVSSNADAPDLPSLEIDGQIYYSWQESIERSVEVQSSLGTLIDNPTQPFSFPAGFSEEPILSRSGDVRGYLRRRTETVQGMMLTKAIPLTGDTWRLEAIVSNETAMRVQPAPDRIMASQFSMASAHLVLHLAGGRFCSMTDPPVHATQHAGECRNEVVWPVLVGTPETCEWLLASPIILPDFPGISPRSAGDYFDGTEIDEMLALRVLTLTDEEKKAMSQCDAFSQEILRRNQNLSEERMSALHGITRIGRADD